MPFDSDWVGLQSLVQVERIGVRAGKPLQQTNYYISSLVTSAAFFAQGFRAHWGIEHRLHWVKDAIFGEDAAPFRNYNAATNWSFIRTLVINVVRIGGYDSLTKAKRFLSHDIDKLFSLLERIIPRFYFPQFCGFNYSAPSKTMLILLHDITLKLPLNCCLNCLSRVLQDLS